MKRSVYSFTCALFVCVTTISARGETWELPVDLTDSNTTVTFVVDSTWHTIHGTAKDLTGIVKLSDPKDPLGVVVDLRIPVRLLDTDSELRDDRMREVMGWERFPEVRFTSTRLSKDCDPRLITRDGSCAGNLAGTLTIRDVTKDINLPAVIRDTAHGYRVEGSIDLRWKDFHVEDPSIIIAKLDPVVTITYRTIIPKKQ